MSNPTRPDVPLGGSPFFGGASDDIFEALNSWKLNRWTALIFDYQFVANSAYNADRGTVLLFSGRLHAEF